jgi:hypothetical protein
MSISSLIKKVKKKECHGQGVKSNDKQAYSQVEFNKVLELFRPENDWDHQYKYPMMALWAYHLIHQLDDTCHFHVESPHGCLLYPFAIQTKMKWSKNVETELQCPDQMLFGSGDRRTWVQLHLSVYLEGWLQRHPNALHMFTENGDVELVPKNLSKQYGNIVKAVCWNNPEFKALENQTRPDQKGLGTHSNKKYTSTSANRRHATKGQVQFRGKWMTEQFHRNQASITFPQMTATPTHLLPLHYAKVHQPNTCCKITMVMVKFTIIGCSLQLFPTSGDDSNEP